MFNQWVSVVPVEFHYTECRIGQQVQKKGTAEIFLTIETPIFHSVVSCVIINDGHLTFNWRRLSLAHSPEVSKCLLSRAYR